MYPSSDLPSYPSRLVQYIIAGDYLNFLLFYPDCPKYTIGKLTIAVMDN